MAAELGLFSLTQLKKLSQQLPHPTSSPSSSSISAAAVSWPMWNPNQIPGQLEEEDDSWEIRAFEQDTGGIHGTTWPPRSYTCTFCRREFRSAQALGGHMNVHRRDRARLHHQVAHPSGATSSSSASNFPTSTTVLIQAPEFVTTNGGLCLIYSVANPNAVVSPLSISNYPQNPHSLSNSEISHLNSGNDTKCESKKDTAVEELDLELRLGRGRH